MARIEKFTVIILAGDRGSSDPVANARAVTRKALTPIAGKPMIDYVVEAVTGAELTNEVLIAANNVGELSAALPEIEDVEWFEGERTPASTILKIMNYRDLNFPVLVVTADNPLLSADRIDDFCRRSLKERALMTVALATRSNIRARFPDMKRTYLKLKGEAYSGCNLFSFKAAAAKDVARFWMNVEEGRKSPIKVTSAFGFWNMLLTLLGRFDLGAAMLRASKVLGVNVAAVIVDEAEAAIDVDRPEHIGIVEEILLARAIPADPTAPDEKDAPDEADVPAEEKAVKKKSGRRKKSGETQKTEQIGEDT